MNHPTFAAAALALALGAILPTAIRGAEEASSPPAAAAGGNASTLRFRRVYAPLDALKELTPPGMRYVPMDSDEFERLVKATQRISVGTPAAAVSAVADAEYLARLAGDSLVDGEAQLELDAAAVEAPRVVLEPCNLAVREAAWDGQPRQPAQFGLADDGRLIVLAPREAPLHLAWSLRGKREPHGAIEFTLDLPPSPATRLVLDLPAGLTPSLNQSLVTEQAPHGEGTVRWRIAVGGHRPLKLRVGAAEAANDPRGTATLRQGLTYDFSPHGVDVSAQLTLDVPDTPLRQIAMETDPELRLVGARYGEMPVRLSRTAARPGVDRRRFVLELPEPLQGSSRVLRISGVAPSPVSRLWRLPALYVEGPLWQEGGITLSVPAPLAIEQLSIQRGRQINTAPLVGPQVGESIEVQCFGPDASVQVLLAQPHAPLQLDSGTAIELSGVEMLGRVAARCRVAEAEHFQLEADVNSPWNIESVETLPANAIDDWAFDAASGRLTIRLAKAILPSRPVRVQIAARWPKSPLGTPLGVDELTPLSFRAPPGGKRLMAVHAGEGLRMKLSGAERLPRLDPQSLTATDLELLTTPQGLLFERGAAAPLQVTVEPQQPTYTANVRVELTASAEGLAESYQMRCVPEGGRVDRVVVAFAPPRSAPLQWTLGAEDEDQFTVRAVPQNESDAPAPAREVWEILLRRPRSAAFDLRATRTVPLASATVPSLAALPAATSQRGTVVVSATNAAAVRVERSRLPSLPAEPVAADLYPTVRAVFRYDPARDLLDPEQPPLVVAPGDARETPTAAWVWNADLESRFVPSGSASHRATYRLQNSGQEQLTLALPPELSPENLRGIWVDGLSAPPHAATGQGQALRVLLPAGRKYPLVVLDFVTTQPPLGTSDSIAACLPEPDVPVLSRTWSLWLPPGYRRATPWTLRQPAEESPNAALKRLFGPLARGDDAHPFDPLARDDWLGLFRPDPAPRRLSQNLERVLERLAAAEASESASSARGAARVAGAPSTWLQALANAAPEPEELRLLVDRRVLEQAPPPLRAPSDADSPPRARIVRWLQRTGLVLLVGEDTVVLTSGAVVAERSEQLLPLEPDFAWYVHPEAMQAQLLADDAANRDLPLVAVEHWKQMPLRRAPWTASPNAGRGPTDALAWSYFRFPIEEGPVVSLAVFHEPTMLAWGWVVFGAIAALGAWKLHSRAKLVLATAGLAGSVALIAPPTYVPIASGVFLGCLWTLLVHLLRRVDTSATTSRQAATPSSQHAATPSFPSTASHAHVGMLVALAALAWSEPAAAAEPSAQNAPPPRAAWEVFVPVDEREKPTGGKLFVPETLYGHLQQTASRAAELPQWQLGSATYRGTLAWQAVPEELIVADLHAVFDLQVFHRNVEVRIPLAHQGARPRPDGVTLDGRQIRFFWPEGSDHMAFTVAEPGKYRIEVPLHPPIDGTTGFAALEVRIPKVPSARLELAIPADAPPLEVPSALGPVTREGHAPQLAAQLGPTDRLRLRWPLGGRRAAGPTFDAEQLLWLKIKPGSVVLDVLVRCQVVEGASRYLEMTIDPRLQRFPLEDESGLVTQIHETVGQPSTLRFELARPVSDAFHVQASLLLTRSSGIGNLRLPYVEVLGARTIQRRLAVSVDPELAVTQHGTQRMQSLAVPQFLAAWGIAKTQPSFAYALSSSRPEWSISTQPAAAPPQVDQTLTFAAAQEGTQVALEARVQASSGFVLQYGLTAPPDLELQRVSLTAEGSERVARWSRTREGRITIFLNGPVSGVQELAIRAQLPRRFQGAAALPLLHLEDVQTKRFQVMVFRAPPVLARVVKSSGLAELERPAPPPSAATLGRLVQAFSVADPDAASLSVAVSPNRPQVEADQTTSLRREGNTWQATVEFRARVRKGVVDEFRLSVPPSWAGPFQCDPPAAIQPFDGQGNTQRDFAVRPLAAVEGEYRLRISGPLAFGAGEPVGPPAVVLQQALVKRRLLVLPSRTASQTFAWETHALAPAPIPADYEATPEARQALVAYQVVQEPYRAVLRSPEGDGPRVLLADFRVAGNADRSCRGIAVFELVPANLSACTLRLPNEYRLGQTTLSGMPIAPRPLGDQRWELALGSSRLPQRIEVLFSGPLPDGTAGGPERLSVPTLENLPVRLALWSVAPPRGATWQCDPELPSASRLDQELARLRALVEAAELAREAPADDSDALALWHRAWQPRWATTLESVKAQLALLEDSHAAQSSRAELEALQKRGAAARERLAPQSAAIEPPRTSTIYDDPTELWLVASEREPGLIRLATHDQVVSLAVTERQERSAPWPSRLSGAIALAVLTVLAVAAMRRRALEEAFDRWPAAVGVLVGLAWWLWLRPSVLGWAIVALSLVAAAHAGWQRSRRRPSAPSPRPR